MFSFLELLIIVLSVIIVFVYFKKKPEGFEPMTVSSYYKSFSEYNDIYDDLYSFYYDDLFYQEPYYISICHGILKYINHVYNNHLCIGIKHGGHINELLKKNMKTTSISKSKSIVNICKHKYSTHTYEHIPEFEKNPYIFDDSYFTHISCIDNELYYIQNFPAFIYNCHKWLMFKGYLFIQCYHNQKDLKRSFVKIGENSLLRIHNVYSHEFRDFSSSNSFSFIETIEPKKKKTRKNTHTLFFYKKEYIENVANEFDLEKIDTIELSDYECMLVFQKKG